jgi:dephospho-CoA kinase/inosine/xanthosine triphosphate pyrophosphatase family protein
MPRRYPRRAFLAPNKRPRLVFFTSSSSKFLQARMVLGLSGLPLTLRAHSEREYRENYSVSQSELLEEAVQEVSRTFGGSGTLFFIEDTTIRINALSSVDNDFPGLRAKEWFQETTFDALDQCLRETRDRTAVVFSDIALSVPGLGRVLFFRGATAGSVVEQVPEFTPDPLYPWLSTENFSAWFKPDGATVSLSEMSFEQSLEYDFRVRSLDKLVDRLEEYTVAANSGPPVYAPPVKLHEVQPSLFPITRSIWLVVGPTCAGKSTFGAYAESFGNAAVVDASSIVRIIRADRGEDSTDIHTFASRLLAEEGPDVIARYIWETFVQPIEPDRPLVITGFRAIEEIQFFRSTDPSVRVISVESSARLRYERYIRRGTRKSITTFTDFQQHEEGQFELGLLPVASELADVRIDNVHSLEVYYNQVASVLGIGNAGAPSITVVKAHLDPTRSQLVRCLQLLRRAGRPLTTQEIEAAFEDTAHVRYNNANKMLKRYPQLVRRQESPGSNVRYQITASGLAFLGAIENMSEA